MIALWQAGVALQCGAIGEGDVLATQLHPALFGKIFEQAADDFTRTTELIGECLMRAV